MPLSKPTFDFLTEDDLIVAQVLADLPNYFTPPGPHWARKRRRSVLPDRGDSQASALRTISNGKTHFKSKAKSPVTPLSFPPSETDTAEALLAPLPPRRRGPKKKTLEELKELIVNLTAEQKGLKLETEELGNFYESLKSLILQFKSHKSQRDGLEDVAVHGSIPFTPLDLVPETETGTGTGTGTGTSPHRSVSIDVPQISKPQTPVNSELSLGHAPRTIHSVVLDLKPCEGDTCFADLGFLPFGVTNKKAGFAQARKIRKERMEFNRIRNSWGLKTNL